jgi:hypothetical protein
MTKKLYSTSKINDVTEKRFRRHSDVQVSGHRKTSSTSLCPKTFNHVREENDDDGVIIADHIDPSFVIHVSERDTHHHHRFLDAPSAVGPYSQAIAVGDLAFISGCIPLDVKTGRIVPGGIEAQVKCALANLGSLVEASGSSLGKVVKTTVRVLCVVWFFLVG